MKKEVQDHLLLHLQSAKRHIDQMISGVTVVPEPLKQVEFDIYEIAAHLGFSPAEVNEDTTKHS